jgi:hypothetical protein
MAAIAIVRCKVCGLPLKDDLARSQPNVGHGRVAAPGLLADGADANMGMSLIMFIMGILLVGGGDVVALSAG